MTDEKAVDLVVAVRELTLTVKVGCERISQGLKEIDETLALGVSRGVIDGEPLPTAGELFERVSSLGAKVVLKSIAEWEKKSGLFSS